MLIKIVETVSMMLLVSRGEKRGKEAGTCHWSERKERTFGEGGRGGGRGGGIHA